MTQEELKVADELFKDIKFYVVGDVEQKVIELLKTGKGKEVSYNALATHIIAEDGDNPEVGESREVFDLPVIKPSWVILSVRCGDLLPVTGFSPESGQIFFGVNACFTGLQDDLSAFWAYVTFYGGKCQLHLNKKVTHLVVKEARGAKFEYALKCAGIKIVTPDWITDSVQDKRRKDEALYHPRLIYTQPEEDEGSESESYEQQSRSDGSFSPQQSQASSGASSAEESSPRRRPGPKKLKSMSRKSPQKQQQQQQSSERMFDDSDDDSSTEKEGSNLNWTPAEVATPTLSVQSGLSRRPGVSASSKEPVSGSALINLCTTVPPGPPGSARALPAEVGSASVSGHATQEGVSLPENIPGWCPTPRNLHAINNTDLQPATRRVNVVQNLATNQTRPAEHQTNQSHAQNLNAPNALVLNQSRVVCPTRIPEQQQSYQQHPNLPQQSPHPIIQLQHQHQMIQLHHKQQQAPVPQPGFVQVTQQAQQAQQQQRQITQQQIFTQQQQQSVFSLQLGSPQLVQPGLQQLHQQHALQQLQQLQQQQRMQMLQQQQQNQQQNQQHPLHLQQQQQQQQHFLQQQQQQMMQQQQHSLQSQQPLQHDNQPPGQHKQQNKLQPQVQEAPQLSQLFGHLPGQDIPQDGFLLGCVFAIADYPEQMADKHLLATWKRVIHACGGAVDSTISSHCTHLLCESQVSNLYVQALREGKRCVTAHWLNTVLKKKVMVPPHRTLHVPFAFPPGAKPCSHHIISVTGFVDEDRDDLKLMAYLTGARYTGYLCRSNTVLICKQSVGLKYEKAKEWKIPCVNAQWLCDILLGNFDALRQIQHSRYSVFTHSEPLAPNPQLVHNLLAAWKMPIKVHPDALANLLQKQKMTDQNNQPENKKARMDGTLSPVKKTRPESVPRVMFTGFEPIEVQHYTKKLQALGGEVAECTQKVTHLIARKVTRTVKFLTAVSVAKHIVKPEWLEDSWKSQKFIEEQSYTLQDAEAEVLFGFTLEESLRRASTSLLFKGKYFYLTPGICPSLSTMKSIVESAGGKLLAKQPTYRKMVEHKQNKDLPEIILISCENDLHLCREYFSKNIDVHNAEFILTGVLTQEVNYNSYRFT